MDTRSIQNIAMLHPKFSPDVVTAWTEAQAAMPSNVKIVIIQGLRTFAESDELYARGRTAPGSIVTKAAAGQSYHNYGLAFDFSMITDGKEDYVVGPNWMKVVNIMKKYGMEWGGEFPDGFHDNPHFENRFGYNWRELLAMYKAGDFIDRTQYVNI